MKSAEYQGKTYSGCFLMIDEKANQAEVRAAGRLGGRRLSVVKFSFDVGLEVHVEGSVVRTASLAMVAKDEATAAEIAALIMKPAEAQKLLKQDLVGAEKSVLDFLKLREEAFSFLAKLRSDPRAASISLAPQWSDEKQDPVDEFLSRSSKQLAKSFESMNSAIKNIESRVGAAAAERLFAFVYCVGSIQDGLLSAKGDLAAESGFLRELGLDATPLEGLRLEGSAQAVLEPNRASLFSVAP